MPDRVPFFTLFESFQAPRQLRLLLHDTVALGGVLDRAARTLELQLESGEPIPDAARSALQQMLAEQYDLRRVQLTFRDKSAPVKGSGEVLLGKEFKGKATPISELNLKMGAAIVRGASSSSSALRRAAPACGGCPSTSPMSIIPSPSAGHWATRRPSSFPPH